VGDSIDCRSPWLEQLSGSTLPQPLTADTATDVAVIGAGIAGVATSFFLLRDTPADVLLIERGRAGHGATGHNAGQLTTYFERPLYDLVDQYGFEAALQAQQTIDESFDLLDIMMGESNTSLPVERFIGHMGMFSLDHVTVHLRSSLLRRRAGLRIPTVSVSDQAPFVDRIDDAFAGLYDVVPDEHVQELLGTDGSSYCAVLSDWKGCANGALLVEQVLDDLQSRFADRFRFVDHTPVGNIVLGDSWATIDAGGHQVEATRVVMCTNGFVEHSIRNTIGPEISPLLHHRVEGDIGYMVGFVDDRPRSPTALSFIRNEVIGGDTPYVYVTTRPFEHPERSGMLTCIGGPERILDDSTVYVADAGFPSEIIEEIDRDVLPLAAPGRRPGTRYDYAWHGLMGYTDSRVRLVGFEPVNPVLMYNLGCNGVGFLPSIAGGHRIAALTRGDDLGPSIFDPASRYVVE
jgi:glycine/D-amino acid oxidase-like deaminating enzyme